MPETGASGAALGFLGRLERWAAADTSADAAALHAALLSRLRAAQAADAANGLIHQLAARALDVADAGLHRGEPAPGMRAQLALSCAAERADLEGARAAVARTAGALLSERGAWVATLSSSTTVRAALLELHGRGRGPRVLVGEGRPLLHGRALASALGQAGVPTWLVVDAALPMLLSQTAALWLGAGAVTDRGAVVAVGGFAIALAAREHSVPVYVLAPRRKFLPGTTAALQIEERPPAEVWDAPTAGVAAQRARRDAAAGAAARRGGRGRRARADRGGHGGARAAAPRAAGGGAGPLSPGCAARPCAARTRIRFRPRQA
jgi:translation initiation factor 2B subunit (eIF-2B alpha/beta/delta family)